MFAHVLLVAAAEPWFAARPVDARVDAARALALVLASVALIALVLVPRGVTRLHIRYEVWRAGHALLARFLASR